MGKRTVMKAIAFLCMMILLVSAQPDFENAKAEDGLGGLATKKLATRSGPGTEYSETGTYNVAGQYIKVLSRAWDKRNEIWWVKCEIPYKGEIRVLWTGYKRFDSSTLPLESIPIEGENNSKIPNQDSSWKSAYRQFFTSGSYKNYIRAVDPEYAGMLAERDTQWDSIALHDMDGDGTPELIIRSDYAVEQADVFVYQNGNVYWVGTMGGDNFFQWIISYRDSGYRGLFTVMGGPAMSITRYTLANGTLNRQDIARTMVDNNGDYTIGIQMYMNDSTLYQLLYNTFVSGRDVSSPLEWYGRSGLNSDSDWNAFFLSY